MNSLHNFINNLKKTFKEGKMSVSKFFKLLIVVAVCSILSVNAFAGGSKKEAPPEEVITVTIWDQFGYEGATAAGPAMDKLVEMYEEQHPNVKIERTFVPQPNIRDQLRMAVSGGTEPNMFYTWPAAAVLASYASNGHLLALTDAANQLGWFHELPELEIKRNSYNGQLYAYPSEQDYMLVYFNKDLFKKVGIKEPESYDEFVQNCEKLKAAGYIPIAFGNRGKWPATNTLSYLFALTAGRDLQEDVFFGDTPWTNDGFLESAELFVAMADAGYFPKGFNGIDYGEANSLFTMQKAAMTITGTWMLQDMVAGSSFDLGMFMLPQYKPELPKATMMGEGSQWSISARASKEAQEEAVKFLDFLTSEENIKIWVEEGYLVPIRKGGLNWEQFDVPDVIKDTFITGDSMQLVNGYDLHTTVPESVTETLYNNLQLMLDKDITPYQFLEAMQESWEKAKRAGEVWVP
jgi:raffinose/stachyose/melibiose transport system substrate-binding protein